MTGKKIGRRELFKLLPGIVVAAAVAAAGKEDETVEMIVQVDSEELAQAILDAPLIRTSVGYAAPPFEFSHQLPEAVRDATLIPVGYHLDFDGYHLDFSGG